MNTHKMDADKENIKEAKDKRRSVITEISNCDSNCEGNLFKEHSNDYNSETSGQEQIPNQTKFSEAEQEINMLNKHDNCKMPIKAKQRLNRELGDLNDTHILSSRLRSSSGKVYSSSVSVTSSQPSSQSPSPATSLVTVAEENTIEDMCPQEGCCKGTTKLMEMMQKLQQSVDGASKKVSTQEILSSNTSHRIQDLHEQMSKNEETIDDMDKELQETKFQLQVVSNVVIRQDQQINFLKQKISEMQQREMAANIIISGIPESKQEKPLILFNTFVQKGLELQELIPANRAFRIGSGPNRPLLVELRNPENKGKLFANATNLKGKRNSKGGSYFISDHLPEDQNEKRRHVNELISENKKKPVSHRLDMSVTKGKLSINEEPYVKQVTAPTARDLLEPPEDLYDKADELDIVRGNSEEQGKSKFISYAVAVHDHMDVKAALLKIRLKYADATHVACAFRLPGANTPINQDYVDDGEYGCGRTMLKVLREEKYMNMAVFLVRFYGGQHLGVGRFDIFRKLARSAVSSLMKKRASEEEKEGEAISHLPENLIQPRTEEGVEQVEDWANDDGDWTAVKKIN